MGNTDNKKNGFVIISVDSGAKGAISLCTVEKNSKLDQKNSKLKILKCVPFDFLGSKLEELGLISEIFQIALREALKSNLEIIGVIERPFPCSKNSRLSISNQFTSYGSTLLALQQNISNVIEINPRQWTSYICTKKEQKLKKDGRILACKRIFGNKVTEYLTVKRKRSTVLHDGIADSLLITVYSAKNLTS